MSGLYDRLRAISQRPEMPAQAREIPRCHTVESWHDVLCPMSEEEMRLLGGYGARPLFLDTETTGLMGGAGTLAILVGIGTLEGGRLHVVQHYLSDYDQEEDMIARVDAAVRESDVLVTYNGKSFDIPLLRSRFVMARQNPTPLDVEHIDLLHGARRVYKRRLYSCTLTDIESQVLDIEREEDLPGKLVPEYWFRYVREGDQALMDEILRHNEQDIVSLALLLGKLCQAYRDPTSLGYRQDTLSVGRAMERMGERERAVEFYDAAGGGEALSAIGRIRKRNRDYDGAARALEQAAELNGSVEAMVELAKIEEHRRRDIAAALRWTDRALAASASPEQIEALIHRRRRLHNKLGGQT